jgi:hypothetical protein
VEIAFDHKTPSMMDDVTEILTKSSHVFVSLPKEEGRLEMNGVFRPLDGAIIPLAILKNTHLWVQLGPSFASSPIEFTIKSHVFFAQQSSCQQFQKSLQIIKKTPTFTCFNGLSRRIGGIQQLKSLEPINVIEPLISSNCQRCHQPKDNQDTCAECVDRIMFSCGCETWLTFEHQCSCCGLHHDCDTLSSRFWDSDVALCV